MYYTLTDKGRPKAVVMSAEEFESWAETLEVMRDFPNLDKDIIAIYWWGKCCKVNTKNIIQFGFGRIALFTLSCVVS